MDDLTRFVSLLPRSRKPANEYIVSGEEAIILLNEGYRARIDAADIPRVKGFRWRVIHVNGSVYVYTTRPENGRSVGYYIHRIITDAPTGLTVDHEDHDPLNNRQSNLRVVTHQVNYQNRKRPRTVKAIEITSANGRVHRYYRVKFRVYGQRFERCFPRTPEGLAAAHQFIESVPANGGGDA